MSTVSTEVSPKDCAETAARALVANPPAADRLLTVDYLMALGGVVAPPDGSSHAEYQKHSLWLCQFTDSLKWQLLDDLSRLLDNVWGKGYRLVNPDDVTEVSTTKVYKRVLAQFGRLGRTLGKLDANKLSPEARRKKTDQEVHAAGLASMVKRADNERKRKDSWREPRQSNTQIINDTPDEPEATGTAG